MPVKEVSNGNLKKELEQAGDKLVLIDFFATWYAFFFFLFFNQSYCIGVVHVKKLRQPLKN
jgi:hypothetical protein